VSAACSQQPATCRLQRGVCESQPSSLVYLLLDLRLNCDAPDATSNNPLAARIERRGHPMPSNAMAALDTPVRRMPIGNELLEGEGRVREREGCHRVSVGAKAHPSLERSRRFLLLRCSLTPPSTSRLDGRGTSMCCTSVYVQGLSDPLSGGHFRRPVTGSRPVSPRGYLASRLYPAEFRYPVPYPSFLHDLAHAPHICTRVIRQDTGNHPIHHRYLIHGKRINSTATARWARDATAGSPSCPAGRRACAEWRRQWRRGRRRRGRPSRAHIP
jgi:hypothetical protein